MNDSPQLLIQWSSPWHEFVSAIRPALRPSPPRLHVEAHAGLFPLRGMLFAFLLEVAALATAIAYPSGAFQPEAVRPSSQTPEVIYFSADELPRTQDLAGGSAGEQGASGGTSLQHPSQTIKVARGENLRARVVDAPDLHLPQSDSQISNLLTYKAAVPPAPDPPPIVRPAITTAPILVHADHERRKQTVLAEVAPPKVSLPKNAMPDLRATSVVAIAPPPVVSPIKVTGNRAQLTLPAPSAPNISARQQMPDLPEAKAAVQAPPPTPSPIKVAHSRPRVASDTSAVEAPPKLDASSTPGRNDQLASIVASPAPDLPAALGQPVGPADSHALGVIVTPNPGPKQAAPKNEEKTTVAMAHGGSSNLGSGGTGGGTGMQPGKGPGSSESGSSSGATTVGNDKGTDFYARSGNSPNLGPGGTGNLSSGTPRVPGVSVSGGKTSITLPSFGGPASPAPAGHSDIAKNMGNGITVIASPRAGGALNFYGALKGDRVYTIYIHTRIGPAIMQFADPASVGRAYTTELTAPRVLQADVPSELLRGQHHSRVLIGCELDSNGKVKNAHLLQSDGSEFAQKILLAVPVWKFTPATRGNQAVAVNAILGFGVDTQ
jgi:Gram-negative bacterial TonB protein C-terminal